MLVLAGKERRHKLELDETGREAGGVVDWQGLNLELQPGEQLRSCHDERARSSQSYLTSTKRSVMDVHIVSIRARTTHLH